MTSQQQPNANLRHPAAAVAAIVLALLFPLYWGSWMFSPTDDWYLALQQDLLQLNLSDVLFIAIGALEIYLYWRLRQIFADQLQQSAAKVLVTIMLLCVLAFHGLVLVDVYATLMPPLKATEIEILTDFSLAIAFLLIIGYCISAVGLAIVLLVKSQQTPVSLKVFCGLLLLSAILQVSVILAMVNLIVFPIALIALAVYFWRDDAAVEVV
ncbi:MAG: hypothetical protein HWE13_11040 [Gammaproteobacteria bacterium]|nr:hypothetical protein [Gammaproteobacteria bacterium]NVK88657.1 hypothetical protein [Gammaproteobacteria bacterium]